MMEKILLVPTLFILGVAMFNTGDPWLMCGAVICFVALVAALVTDFDK